MSVSRSIISIFNCKNTFQLNYSYFQWKILKSYKYNISNFKIKQKELMINIDNIFILLKYKLLIFMYKQFLIKIGKD